MNIVKSLVEGYAKINTATRLAKQIILAKVQFWYIFVKLMIL